MKTTIISWIVVIFIAISAIGACSSGSLTPMDLLRNGENRM